jgi:hypothetical protein
MLTRRLKSDEEGQGSTSYLSRGTVKWLKVWLEPSGVKEEAIFWRPYGQDAIERLLWSRSGG